MAKQSFGIYIRRFGPLFILLCVLVVVYIFRLDQYISFEILRQHRQTLLAFVSTYPIWAPLLFMTIYAIVIALSIPGGAIMTISGGFLFGSLMGTLYVVVAATIGATMVFFAAQTALGDSLRRYVGPGIQKMRKGFQKDGFHYLLVLRLVPLFPFFLVNLAPAFLGVKTRTYIAATFIGIIPGSFVYASVGAGIGSVFDAGETFDPRHVLTPQVWIALIGLAVLAILPVLYRRYKDNKLGSKKD